MDNQEYLSKLHSEILIIMDEIHRVCVENGLKYYLVGGSLLGAVRHKGFIPWDDDIDIGMPRADLEKFCRLAEEKLSAPLGFVGYKNTPGHIYFHPNGCFVNSNFANG